MKTNTPAPSVALKQGGRQPVVESKANAEVDSAGKRKDTNTDTNTDTDTKTQTQKTQTQTQTQTQTRTNTKHNEQAREAITTDY
jgi:hypothetical protein